MGKYAVRLEDTFTAATTIGTIKADATRPRRLKLYYVEIGITGADASNTYDIPVLRLDNTGAGTSTAVTPLPLDPADAATEFDAAENYTVEPTNYTANSEMLSFQFNQRTTVQWHARPGSEIVVPATAGNGLGFRPATATALTGVVQLHVEEQ